MADPNSTTTPLYLFQGDAADGVLLGAAAGKMGFYGKTPVTQRASSVQAASIVSASTYITVPANLAAWAAEVNATLTGLGLWKGAA